MAIKLTKEQGMQCYYAFCDVGRDGKTDRKCPIFGSALVIEVLGNSGVISCSTPDCFEKITLRGI